MKSMKIFAIAAALAALSGSASVAQDPDEVRSYLVYAEDVWTTIMDHNETGKWNQSLTDDGYEIATVRHAGCIDDVSLCIKSARIYPNGHMIVEYMPLDI